MERILRKPLNRTAHDRTGHGWPMTKAETAHEYEQAIMDAHARGVEPPAIQPPEGYVMSPEFQTWLVNKMRDDVVGQTGGIASMVSKQQNGADDDQD